MNKLKNMTREELINELESKGICVVLDNDLDDYVEYLDDIYDAFDEIIDDIKDTYFSKPTPRQLKESWLSRVKAGYDEEYDEYFAKAFYYEDCILNEINSGNARKFLKWLGDKNIFFTFITLTNNGKSVDLVEYHPLNDLESYLLDDKQALEKVFFEQ